MNITGLIKLIAHHYGFEAQREILVEECAELIQASQKCKRNQIHAFDNFISELADVYIMVMQIIHLVGTDEVNREIEKKLVRQLRRIAKEKGEGNMNEASIFETLMKDKHKEFTVDDRIEQAYRQGYEAGLKAAEETEEKHWSECRQISEYDIEIKELKKKIKSLEELNNRLRETIARNTEVEYE